MLPAVARPSSGLWFAIASERTAVVTERIDGVKFALNNDRSIDRVVMRDLENFQSILRSRSQSVLIYHIQEKI